MTHILVLVGLPGSGKSALCAALVATFNEWVIVSQTDLGSKQTCLQKCLDLVKAGKNVIVDCVNYDENERLPWIKISQDNYIPVSAIFMDASCKVCKSRVSKRQGHLSGVEGKFGAEVVSRIDRLLTEPTVYEGFRVCLRISGYVLNKNVENLPFAQIYSKNILERILLALGHDFNDALKLQPKPDSKPVPKPDHHSHNHSQYMPQHQNQNQNQHTSHCELQTHLNATLIESVYSLPQTPPRRNSRVYQDDQEKVHVTVNVNQPNYSQSGDCNGYDSFYKKDPSPKSPNYCTHSCSDRRSGSVKQRQCYEKHTAHCSNRYSSDSEDCSHSRNEFASLQSYDQLNHGMYNMSMSKPQQHQSGMCRSLDVLGGSGKYEETKHSTKDNDGTNHHDHEIIHERAENTRGEHGDQYHKVAHRARNNMKENETRKFRSNMQESEFEETAIGVKVRCNGEKVHVQQSGRAYNRSEKSADTKNGVFSSVQHKTKSSIESESLFDSHQNKNHNHNFFGEPVSHAFFTNGTNLGLQPGSFFMKRRDFETEFGFLHKSSPFKANFSSPWDSHRKF